MAKPINVLGICGSLRAGSYNRMALRTAAELVPPGMRIEMANIAGMPEYNDDVDYPAVALEFRARVKAADAILFATPEYLHSIPGGLKNALDWAWRKPDTPFDDKPVAIMGAATSPIGSGRAQYHLRNICQALHCHPVTLPEVMIGLCDKKFDEAGRLTDDKARAGIRDLLLALDAWTRRLRGE